MHNESHLDHVERANYGLSLAETARALNCSKNNVAKTERRALAKLRRKLSEVLTPEEFAFLRERYGRI